jgi:hypothetical protein
MAGRIIRVPYRSRPIVLALLLSTGCIDPGASEVDEADHLDTGNNTLPNGNAPCGDDAARRESTASISWWATGVSFCIVNGDPGGYRFGLVPTDPLLDDPWLGEDCWHGDVDASGAPIDNCHPAEEGLNVWASGADPETLDPASETAFTAADEDILTYYLHEVASGSCWVWGADVSYYTELRCTQI